MNIIFLGTGPARPIRGRGRNYRTNSSILIETKKGNILIDVTPMIEEQTLKNAVDKVDAIFITHGHSDCVKGLPECIDKFGKLPIYASKQTFKIIDKYYKTLVYDKQEIKKNESFELFDLKIVPFKVIHAEAFPTGKKFPVLAFKFDNIIYAEDMESIPKESEKYFENLDLLVIDAALYWNKHIRGHLNTLEALQIIQKYKPKRAILTQIGRSYPDYYKAKKRIDEYMKNYKISSKVEMAYDGLVIEDVSLKKKLSIMLGQNREAIYLSKLDGENIYNNKKKLIILTKKYEDKIDKKLYLIDGEFCYGIIKLSKPKKITLEETENLEDFPKLTKEEKKELEDSEEIYAYEFEILECFPEKKPIEKPKEKKLFVREFIFGPYKQADYKGFTRSFEMIENAYDYDVAHLDNRTLQDDFRLAVAYRSRLLKNEKVRYGKDTIVGLGTKILKEILKRKKENKMNWKANPEEGSEAYKVLWQEVTLIEEEKNILLGNELNIKKLKEAIMDWMVS